MTWHDEYREQQLDALADTVYEELDTKKVAELESLARKLMSDDIVNEWLTEFPVVELLAAVVAETTPATKSDWIGLLADEFGVGELADHLWQPEQVERPWNRRTHDPSPH